VIWSQAAMLLNRRLIAQDVNKVAMDYPMDLSAKLA
jgi:hypothetical protein